MTLILAAIPRELRVAVGDEGSWGVAPAVRAELPDGAIRALADSGDAASRGGTDYFMRQMVSLVGGKEEK